MKKTKLLTKKSFNLMVRAFTVGLLVSASLFSCTTEPTSQPENPTQPITPSVPTTTPTASQTELKADAQLARDWMELVRQIVKETKTHPPGAARIYAYAGVALYEATRSAFPELKTLAGRLHRLDKLPELKSAPLPETLKATMAPLLKHFFPTLPETSLKALADLEAKTAARTDIKKASADELKLANSQGQSLAQALITWSQSDGYAEIKSKSYILPDFSQNLSLWQPTAPEQKPLEPYWGEIKTLALANVDTCPTSPTVSFSTAADSDFYKQAQEVQETVKNITPEQTTIAKWWADGPGDTATPPGHWVSLVGQVSQQQKWDLLNTTKTYAYTGITLMDGFIACWKSKYIHNLLRPVTYIQNVIGDKEWKSLIGTPGFPEYPSGHSTGSGAAAEMLTHLWGEIAFEDSANTSLGMSARKYKNFNIAAEEAAISRLYGGIHFRDAIDQGVSQGRCVTQSVLKTLGE